MNITDHSNIVRDDESKAIVSTDRVAFEELKRKRAMSARMASIESRLSHLETTLNNISVTLTKLLEKQCQ